MTLSNAADTLIFGGLAVTVTGLITALVVEPSSEESEPVVTVGASAGATGAYLTLEGRW